MVGPRRDNGGGAGARRVAGAGRHGGGVMLGDGIGGTDGAEVTRESSGMDGYLLPLCRDAQK